MTLARMQWGAMKKAIMLLGVGKTRSQPSRALKIPVPGVLLALSAANPLPQDQNM